MAARGNPGQHWTLYTSLLQATVEDVADEEDEEDETLATGIAALLRKRAEMMAVTSGAKSGSAPARARATMSYDAALVRLCQRLEIEHHFFAGLSPEAARAGAEAALGRRMPALSADFTGSAELVPDEPRKAAEGPEPGA